MFSVRRRLATVLALLMLAGLTVSAQDVTPAPQAPAAQDDDARQRDLQEKADDEFVPISELPPEERLPAAPMLVAAYAAVMLGVFAYLLSLSRRLGSVKQEIARLDAEVKRGSRS